MEKIKLRPDALVHIELKRNPLRENGIVVNQIFLECEYYFSFLDHSQHIEKLLFYATPKLNILRHFVGKLDKTDCLLLNKFDKKS